MSTSRFIKVRFPIKEKAPARVENSGSWYNAGTRRYAIETAFYMAIALFITGIAAHVAYTMDIVGLFRLTNIGNVWGMNSLYWLAILMPIELVLCFASKIERLCRWSAQVLLLLYSVSVGVAMASIFLVCTESNVSAVFFGLAAVFLCFGLFFTMRVHLRNKLSLSFFSFAGILLISIINIFWRTSIVYFGSSFVLAGIYMFSIRRLARRRGNNLSRGGEVGALSLYMGLLDVPIYLLQHLGESEMKLRVSRFFKKLMRIRRLP